MKKLLIGVVAVMLLAGSASAADCAPKVWDDLSWWGNSGATPEPQPDRGAAICGGEPRSCYWWWPQDPNGGDASCPAELAKTASLTSSTGADTELWGNRGLVYACWVKPGDVIPPPPPDTPDPKAIRKTVIFNNVLFDFDKAVLKPEGKAVVDQVIAEMKAHGGDTVLIEGHTCDLGSDAYNMGLGQRRADAVKSYMLENGIDAGRITTQSFGESDPAVANDGDANRKLNRRAEFNITIVN
ncbi:MAG: OmpA family protein [Candidatus Hydrogenedentes bacterium]|nr:OmpA family protein [Candidatus Hydrogenedentota bacterium]